MKNNNGSALAVPNGASLKLTVKGDNLLRSYAAGPGILVDNGAELEINGTDNDILEVYGSRMESYTEGDLSGGMEIGFAGIGGSNSGSAYTYTGKITINGGKIGAHGYGYGAGIGGGDYGSGGTITIKGGIITATTGEGLPEGWISSSKANASGIGASQGQEGGTILITGGTVTATGGYGCAGIGGGTADVTISGGNVTAYGGPQAAGIGGYDQNKGDIKITIGAGATVTAYGGSGGCGLGQGPNKTAPTTLNIEKGAKVIAFSKENSNRPAVTASANSAENPANMVNAYITNMTLPADVPVTAVLGNETVNLTVPAGAGGVAFTTEAAGEFIAKTSVAVGGITYQFIPVDNSKATVTSGNTLTEEKVKAVTAAELSKEETPNAQIDYENGRLNGVTANADYRLSYEGAPDGYYLDLTADNEGNLTHQIFEQFYGKKVSVIKLGNGETTLNSDPQWIFIKQVQATLSIESVPEKVYGDESFELSVTGGSGTGVLTYVVSMGNNIQVDENGRVTILGAGESTVTVTKAEDDNYASISQNTVITVSPRPIDVVWHDTENLVYDNTEKTISASVRNIVSGDTVNLTLTGTVKATAKGIYTATVTAVDNSNYTLTGGLNLSKEWSVAAGSNAWTTELTLNGWTYGESAITPTATAKFGAAVFSYSDSENGAYTNTVPQNAGTYWVKATVPGTENYAEISTKKEFVIAKAMPNYSVPAGITAIYGDTLADVTLPAGWTWANSTQRVGNVGNHTFKATFTPADTNNFNIVTDVDISVAVKQRPVNIVWSGTENLVYDGTEKTISASVRNIVSGDTANLTLAGNVKATEKGSYTATVTAVDNSNYTLAGGTNLEKNWSISETENEWTQELTITGWTFGETAGVPQATAKYGTVVFSYSDSENGEYTENIPQNAGTYWVMAAVSGTVSYAEISAKKEFVIAKANPVIAETPKAARVRKGYELSKSAISGGIVKGLNDTVLEGTFAWKDGTEVMNETGEFTKTAVFTPADENYAPVEADISVTVYRPSSGGGTSVTKYTVTFDTQGGSKISSSSVTRNTAVKEPAEPTKEGYTFGGWFTSKECTEEYDFASKVTKNTTLYAKWTEDGKEPTEPDEWENPFTDVDEGDWFYDAVQYVNENGLFSGVTETMFAPSEAITRGMLVTVLWRMEDKPVVNYLMTFDDVSENAYYAEAVRWAASNGIVKGYSDTEFAPDKLISREEIAAIMQRYATFKGIDTTEKVDLSKFTDHAAVSEWAKANVEWAVGYGLISGKDGNILEPQGNTTRAEAAAILQRFLEKTMK